MRTLCFHLTNNPRSKVEEIEVSASELSSKLIFCVAFVGFTKDEVVIESTSSSSARFGG